MSDLDPMRIELREHLLAHAVRTGDFVLKSGRKSNWFEMLDRTTQKQSNTVPMWNGCSSAQ